jgi:hypothetical protein
VVCLAMNEQGFFLQQVVRDTPRGRNHRPAVETFLKSRF